MIKHSTNEFDKRRKSPILKDLQDFLEDITHEVAVFAPLDLLKFRSNVYVRAKQLGLQVSTKTFINTLNMSERMIVKKLNFTPTTIETVAQDSLNSLYDEHND